MHVAICIATFKRPRLLQKLLNGIAELKFHKVGIPEITIVVVDNDAAATARDVCSAAILPWRLKYVIEPKRGIAEARNRGLREIGAAGFVAFIDDDEVPANAWLDELLLTQANFHADVVAGPVCRAFADDVPGWIRRANFFDRPAHLTGELLPCCSTGNVLVVRSVFDRVGGFDDRFQLTGGEDIHFFTRVRRAGFNIVWSQEAVVTGENLRRQSQSGIAPGTRISWREFLCFCGILTRWLCLSRPHPVFERLRANRSGFSECMRVPDYRSSPGPRSRAWESLLRHGHARSPCRRSLQSL